MNWKYSFDTSAFIDSWRRYYPNDVFKNLWNIIEEKMKDQVIVSTSIVKDEIDYQEDDLKVFINQHPENFVIPDRKTQQYVSNILSDINFEKWKTGITDVADPFVVGFAKANNLIVVSYENLRSPNKIPAACRKLGVTHYSFLEFLRAEGIVI